MANSEENQPHKVESFGNIEIVQKNYDEIKIEIITLTDDYMKIRVYDDPHTILNPLNEILSEREDVELVGYTREKTFEDISIFQLRMKPGTIHPAQAFKEAINHLKELTNDFMEAFDNRGTPEE